MGSVMIWRVSKGGAWRWARDGQDGGKPYMGLDQAERAARKANPDADLQVVRDTDLPRHHFIGAAEAMQRYGIQ